MPGMASATGAVPGTSSRSGSSYGSNGNDSSTSSRSSGRDITRGSSFDSERRMLTEACSDWVREKPLSAVAMAFGIGLLVGRVGR